MNATTQLSNPHIPAMKSNHHLSPALLASAALLLTITFADARCYGICRRPYERGVAVPPVRGVVVGENDNTYVDSNVPDPSGQNTPPPMAKPTTVPDGDDIPMNAYSSSIPADYKVVTFQGQPCYLANGVYYRPLFYNGGTVYVTVTPSAF